MRTNWGARANKDTPDLLPDYEPSVDAVANALKSYWGNETGDPVKVAQLVLRLAASDSLPAHLLLGSDAAQFATQAEATRAADAVRRREIGVSTDVDAPGSLPVMQVLTVSVIFLRTTGRLRRARFSAASPDLREPENR
jgi:hypothetical protein